MKRREMRAKNLRQLTVAELQTKHDELVAKHFDLRIKHTLGQLENPLDLRLTRRDIARTKGLLQEQGMAITPRRRRTTAAPAAAKTVKPKAKKPAVEAEKKPEKKAEKKITKKAQNAKTAKKAKKAEKAVKAAR